MVDDIALLQPTSDGIAADGTTRIVLRWETVGQAIGYRLHRRTPGGASVVLGGVDPIRLPRSATERAERSVRKSCARTRGKDECER